MIKQRTKSQQDSQTRHVPIGRFARNLRAAWKELNLPTTGETVVVAVSGGADSTALFLALDELIKSNKLNVKLVVAHLDHGLRTESANDAGWVKQLANELGYTVVVGKANLKTASGKPVANLEQAARTRRYEFLLRTAKKHKATFVLTAHTLDDQAETVLLRLLRGSAAEGLSGTLAVRDLKKGSPVKLARPLIGWARRSETEDYCRVRHVAFRSDEMNDDERFSRVKVRKQLLPLMASFNKQIVETLSRTASLLSEDAFALSTQAAELLQLATAGQSKNSETKGAPVNVKVLLAAPAAIRRRALREWLAAARGNLRRVEMSHLLAVEKLLNGRGGSVAELPGSLAVLRNGQFLKVFNRTKPDAARPRSQKRLKKRPAASKISRR